MDASVRKTYPQNWKAYNSAQTQEKEIFLKLLYELCAPLADTPPVRPGRPRILFQDIVFSICYKVYGGFSGRRFMSDLRDAQTKGYITKTPHFNSIFNYLDDPDFTPALRILVNKSSLPLKGIECDFAVDSSGFMTSTFDRWFDHKYGARTQREWVKAHIMCGVKTNIVTAIEIIDKNTNDTKLLPHLVDSTAANFQIREVTADKAYGSRRNYEAVTHQGGMLFSPFKENATGRVGGLWAEMFHYFQYRKEDFYRHYHKRSNVESTFSMIKAKFGSHVRSKTDTAMKNEVMVKIICHNICCLIQESHELGIDVHLWAKSSDAQKSPSF